MKKRVKRVDQKLDAEEQEILDSFERGECVCVYNLA